MNTPEIARLNMNLPPMLTPDSEALFDHIVGDLGNWGGFAPCFNHVNKFTRGNLTQLKRAGLVQTFTQMNEEWIQLTETGRARAVARGLQGITAPA